MTNEVSPRPRRRGRSAWALFAGFLVVIILSIGTDLLLHATAVFPPSGQPMSDGLFLLATVYRPPTPSSAATSRRGSRPIGPCSTRSSAERSG